MKLVNLKKALGILLVGNLLLNTVPIDTFAEIIHEDMEWKEILTTYEEEENIADINDIVNMTSELPQEAQETPTLTFEEMEFTSEYADETYETDRFIIKYKTRENNKKQVIDSETVDFQATLSTLGEDIVAVDISSFDSPKSNVEFAVAATSETVVASELLEAIRNEMPEEAKEIEHIQPDFAMGISAVDPYLEKQWGHEQVYDPLSALNLNYMENQGKENGKEDISPYKMDADVIKAWDTSKGSEVVVAVLDTGIETNHEDLLDNMLSGWDFVNNDDSVNDEAWSMDQWHGTHIAGIIAARGENGIGISGVAPEAKILPLKVFQGGTAYTSDIIEAIAYAEEHGAQIVNCSWGSMYENIALRDAVESSSMLFICATGNSLYNIDKYPVYPASYDLDNVISVTSVDRDGKLSMFANYGNETVDIAAPGYEIYSTDINNSYAENSGTSMAAAYVSGAAALLLSEHQDYSAYEIKERLKASGDIVTGLEQSVIEGKKLNCAYAVSDNKKENKNKIDVEAAEIPEISPSELPENEYESYAQNHISIKAPMITARYGLGVISVDGKIYAIGGSAVNGYSNKVEVFTPSENTWTEKAAMPTAVSYFGITAIGSNIYVLGGYNGRYLNTVQVYNTKTDEWTIKPADHNMPVAMNSFTATAYNNKIYVIGGYTGSFRNTIYEYNPSTGSWTAKKSLSHDRSEHTAVEYEGKIYLNGGRTTNGSGFNVEEVYDIKANIIKQTGPSRIHTSYGAAVGIGKRYIGIGGQVLNQNTYSKTIISKSLDDPNNIFRVANSMYVARAGLGACEVDGKLYMIGGHNNGSVVSVVEEMDLGWDAIGELPAPVRGFETVECNGMLYMIGGETLTDETNVRSKSVYEFNPALSQWTKKQDMPFYKNNYSIASLYGKIYLIGGSQSASDTGAWIPDYGVYEYDPTSDEWLEKERNSKLVSGTGATDYLGKIYVSGGISSNKLLVYDPIDDSWEEKRNLPSEKSNHFTTVLGNEIYTVGGNNSTIYCYDTANDRWSTKDSSLGLGKDYFVNIYNNIYSFTSAAGGSDIPLFAKYDHNTDKIVNFASFYFYKHPSHIAALGSKAYFFTGNDGYASELIEYRPSVNPWGRVNPTSGKPTYLMGIGVIGTDIYHVGGELFNSDDSKSYPTNQLMKFTHSQSQGYWESKANMQYSRSRLAVGTINGKLYAAGGSSTNSGNAVDYVEEYDPKSNEWKSKRSMPVGLYDMAYAVYNGKLYTFGGKRGSSTYNTTYIYDPVKDQWSTGASLPTARYGGRAALLEDGKIYVAGGFLNNGTSTDKLEVYDPAANTWTTKQKLPEALGHSAVVGLDTLYVIGGTDGRECSSLVYEYRPKVDKWFSWPGPGLALFGSGAAITQNGIYVINGQDIALTTYSFTSYLPLESYDAEYIHMGEETINLSGNLSRNYTDMEIQSPGFNISISRTYNSRDDRIEGNIISKGWTFGFQGYIDSSGNDTLVRLPNGSGVFFKEDSNGLYSAKDSRSSLTKDKDGIYTMTTKDHYSYGFNNDGYLIWMKDPNGNQINITVDSTGKITKVTDAVERAITLTYSSDRISTITDAAGRKVIYTYDNKGQLSAVTDPMSNVTQYKYDVNGVLTEIQNHQNDLVEKFEYYEMLSHETTSKVKAVVNASGNTETYTYNEGDGLIQVKDSSGRETAAWYDTMLYPIRIKDADGKEKHIEYNLTNGINKYGEEKTVVDRDGNAVFYNRDAHGNIIRQINPDGSIKEFTYDEKDNLTSETDESGKKRYYVYDSEGINLLKEIVPLNGVDLYVMDGSEDSFAVTEYSYYTSAEGKAMCGKSIGGLLKSMKDPNGNIATYVYDRNGCLSAVTNAANQTTTYKYNDIGWLVQETDAKGYTTKFNYDRNGKIIKKTNHGGETERVIYDSNGNVVQSIKANQYDASSDSAAIDSLGILKGANTYTQTGHGYRYKYYLNGLPQKETDPLGFETSLEYDVYGNKIKETMPNGLINIFYYDELNRLTKKSYMSAYSAAETITDEYMYSTSGDGCSEVIQREYYSDTNIAETKKIYNYAQNLIREERPDGKITTNEYFPNGTLALSTDAKGGKTYYTYDGLNREIGRWVETQNELYCYNGTQYDKNGNIVKEILANELVEKYADTGTNYAYTSSVFDGAGRVTEETDSSGGKTTYYYDDLDDSIIRYIYASGHMSSKVTTRYHYLGGVKQENIDNLPDLITKYDYDKEGNILTETRPDEVMTTYWYDLLGRKVKESQPGIDENEVSCTIDKEYSYDFRGNILTEKNSTGDITEYHYSLMGRLTSIVEPSKGVHYFSYDRRGNIVTEITPQNYADGSSRARGKKTYDYDNMGRVIRETETYRDESREYKQIHISYEYDGNGNLTHVTDGAGNVTSYTYDKANQQITVLDAQAAADGHSFTEKYTYNGLGHKVKTETGSGLTYDYTYNDRGLLLVSKLDGKIKQSFEYDLKGNKTKETDSNGYSTTYTYDRVDRVSKVIHPGGEHLSPYEESYTYNTAGEVAKWEDSMGKIREYTYSNQGDILVETERNSNGGERITKSYRYDLNGRMRFAVDGNRNTTEYTYDNVDNVISIDNGKVTTFKYDLNGNQTQAVDWRGNIYVYAYDSIDRLISKKDPYGKVIEKLYYNDNHQQIASVDALGNTTRFEYDRIGQLIATTDPSGKTETMNYDIAGNMSSLKDGEGNISKFSYDADNNLISVVNALGEETRYTYDLEGNILTATDANGDVAQYNYTARNLLISSSDFSSQAGEYEYYTYYANGDMESKKEKDRTETQYRYDVHGQLISQNTRGEVIEYTYDGNGNQRSMTDKTGITRRQYDVQNRVTSKTDPAAGLIIYSYDQPSNIGTGYMEEVTRYPNGEEVRKVIDKANRLYQVKDGSDFVVYDYYDNGNVEKVSYGRGGGEEYTYYANGQLRTLVNYDKSGIVEAYSYDYDQNNNMISATDKKGTTNYRYDALNRLLSVTEPGKATEYEFDHVGNRLQEAVEVDGEKTITKYTYNELRQLVSTQTLIDNSVTRGVDYSYDYNGNMIASLPYSLENTESNVPLNFHISIAPEDEIEGSDVGAIYEYDERNNLVKVVSGQTVIENQYNGDGLRISKTVNGNTTLYLYEYDKIVLEMDKEKNTIGQNIYGLHLLKRKVDDEQLYYLYNGHGDVTALLDQGGTVAAQYSYDAFGTLVEEIGIVNNPFRYAGYEYDAEARLYYLKSRFYDPAISRFMQRDVYLGNIQDPLSLNRYSYCNNNPLSYVDPWGYSPIGLAVKIVVKVGTTAAVKTTVKTVTNKRNRIAESSPKVDITLFDGTSVKGFNVNGVTYYNNWDRPPELSTVHTSVGDYIIVNGEGIKLDDSNYERVLQHVNNLKETNDIGDGRQYVMVKSPYSEGGTRSQLGYIDSAAGGTVFLNGDRITDGTYVTFQNGDQYLMENGVGKLVSGMRLSDDGKYMIINGIYCEYSSSSGLVRLPQSGPGFTTYGYSYGINWASPDAMQSILNVAKTWSEMYPNNLLQLGDISSKTGGNGGRHQSHTNGLSLDLRPVRTDDAIAGVKYNASAYDRERTDKLISLFINDGNVRNIYFNDKAMIDKYQAVSHLGGHDDHLHVNFLK